MDAMLQGQGSERRYQEPPVVPVVSVSQSLALAVQAEIIPRLMLLHMSPASVVAEPPIDVMMFSELLMADAPDVPGAHVDTLLDGGTPAEILLVDLLLPAAVHLSAIAGRHPDVVPLALSRLHRLMTSVRSRGTDEGG